MRFLRKVAIAFGALALVGCGADDSLTPSRASRSPALAQVASTPRCAPAYEATCYTDDELAAAVTRYGGAVFIGIAPAGFPHPFDAIRTGRNPNWDSVSFELEIDRFRALGLQASRRFRHLGVVAAHVSPQLAVQLRRLPTTWFIEPQFPRNQRWGVMRGSVLASWSVVALQSAEAYPDLRSQQLRDWGVTSIGAPTRNVSLSTANRRTMLS